MFTILFTLKNNKKTMNVQIITLRILKQFKGELKV